jgi:hypothetical protein
VNGMEKMLLSLLVESSQCHPSSLLFLLSRPDVCILGSSTKAISKNLFNPEERLMHIRRTYKTTRRSMLVCTSQLSRIINVAHGDVFF